MLAALLATLVLLLVALGAFFVHQHAEQQRAAEKARLERQAAELAAGCSCAKRAARPVAWKQFRPSPPRARRRGGAHGARGLRHALAARGAHLGRQGELLRPGRAAPTGAGAGLAAARGERRADLQAHLGWADFLRGRDGIATDPAALYRNALADDAGNVYAHTMWAHWLVWQGGKLEGEVRQHLEAAARSPREHPWLRRMQFAIASLRGELNGYALGCSTRCARPASSPMRHSVISPGAA